MYGYFSHCCGIFILLILLWKIDESISHGRMMQPPARNAMWRFGYRTPINYDDNQNWCGGAAVMIQENHGKCGICGDNYADPKPRPHEAGGIYGTGVVVKRYSPNQLINVEIELTANHQGTFQFKLCPVENPKVEVSQDCLDRNLLDLFDAHEKVSKTYSIISPEKRKTFEIKVKLPSLLSCSQCVLQWTYVASNTWGTCTNGTEAVGCGPQETFINCADIAIIPNTGGHPPISTPAPPVIANTLFYSENNKTEEQKPLLIKSQVCIARDNSTIGMNDWCQLNCLRYPSNCPSDDCKCIESCDAIGSFKDKPGSDVFCMQYCLHYPFSSTKCTWDKCRCH